MSASSSRRPCTSAPGRSPAGTRPPACTDPARSSCGMHHPHAGRRRRRGESVREDVRHEVGVNRHLRAGHTGCRPGGRPARVAHMGEAVHGWRRSREPTTGDPRGERQQRSEVLVERAGEHHHPVDEMELRQVNHLTGSRRWCRLIACAHVGTVPACWNGAVHPAETTATDTHTAAMSQILVAVVPPDSRSSSPQTSPPRTHSTQGERQIRRRPHARRVGLRRFPRRATDLSSSRCGRDSPSCGPRRTDH